MRSVARLTSESHARLGSYLFSTVGLRPGRLARQWDLSIQALRAQPARQWRPGGGYVFRDFTLTRTVASDASMSHLFE